MSDALAVYETLPAHAKQEVNDFIYFMASKGNSGANSESSDFAFIDNMVGILSHEDVEDMRKHCHLQFKET